MASNQKSLSQLSLIPKPKQSYSPELEPEKPGVISSLLPIFLSKVKAMHAHKEDTGKSPNEGSVLRIYAGSSDLAPYPAGPRPQIRRTWSSNHKYNFLDRNPES